LSQFKQRYDRRKGQYVLFDDYTKDEIACQSEPFIDIPLQTARQEVIESLKNIAEEDEAFLISFNEQNNTVTTMLVMHDDNLRKCIAHCIVTFPTFRSALINALKDTIGFYRDDLRKAEDN